MNLSFPKIPRPKYPKYGPLYFQAHDLSGLLHVLKPFEFEIAPGKKECVEPGFKSDLASIPIFIRALFPPYGRYTKPSVVHDWHYKQGGVWKLWADWQFFKGMLVLGVPLWKATIFLAAVATVGWIAWYKHRWADYRSSSNTGTDSSE